MNAKSAAATRLERNAAIIAAHPRWHGIQHPELIPFPPRRFSKLDVLTPSGHVHRPVRSVPGRANGSRAERIALNRELVATHPRWCGITHPERIVFPAPGRVRDPLLDYREAILRALRGVHESEELTARISAVADAIDRRSWPWAASPHELDPEGPSRPSRPRRLRTPAPRFRLPEWRVGRYVHRDSRLIAH